MSARGPAALLLCAALSPGLAAAECDGVEPVAGEAITLRLVHPLLNRPVGVTSPPGDTERLFVVEQRGLVRIVDLRTDTLLTTPFLSLASRVGQSGNEEGLLGLAFHPQWRETGWVFVCYTVGASGDLVVARFSVSEDDPDVVDPASELVLLRVPQPASTENGGRIAFGPHDGLLYVATGYGGEPGDPQSRAQDPASLLGKVLRLDIDGATEEAPYAVPPDNPWAGRDDVRPEVWALGLRNPWGFAFDRETGNLWIADVGEDQREELDVIPAGEGGFNFGWSQREGDREFDPDAVLTLGEPVEPVLTYPHQAAEGAAGCAVVGGVVYRGCRFPDLRGTYFFADHCGDWVRSLRRVDGEIAGLRDRTEELNVSIPTSRIRSISTFGTDGRGEVYIAELSGKLFRVVQRTANIPPRARIVTDPSPPELQLASGTASILLDGRGSDDGDDGTQEMTFLWEKLEGPSGDFLSNRNAAATEAVYGRPGTYRYRLTVDDGEAQDTAEVTVLVVAPSETRLRRADTNLDGVVDLSDGVATLQHLFLGGPLACDDAADADDSGDVDLSDGVFTFNYLFLGGKRPPAPGPETCGPDPTADLLEACEDIDACP